MSIAAWAAPKAHSSLEPFSYEAASLAGGDVEIRISHCGVCHSDVHLINDDWGSSRYPLVPGHEIVGTVTHTGRDVRHLRPGQRVGVGWQRSSCGTCEYCRRGEENLCATKQYTCVGHHGGFAAAMVISGQLVFPLPESLEAAITAPLLCAGITVFSPLRHHGVGSGTRVGVIGIGGLGHLALQFAAKLGAEVTALSSSPSKEADARRFGASRFLDVSTPGTVQAARRSLDFILSTVHVDLPWSDYLKMLRPNGKLCFVGSPPAGLGLSAGDLISGQKMVVGSGVGGSAAMTEMLAFAAAHGVKAEVETRPMAEVNAAVQRVVRNEARYRMVLVNPA